MRRSLLPSDPLDAVLIFLLASAFVNFCFRFIKKKKPKMSDDDDEEGVAEARNAPKQPDEEEEEDIFGFFFINLKQKLTKDGIERCVVAQHRHRRRNVPFHNVPPPNTG